MTPRTLYLAWQDKGRTRRWFPVGRLDVAGPRSPYRFRYIQGANSARQQSGFAALMDFPDMQKEYVSRELFPMFQNRVMMPGRPDFRDYLKRLDLPEMAEPMEMLAVDGGFRATDNFEVFPKIERSAEGAFHCRFFLHGWRHVSVAAQQRLDQLVAGEKLYVALELTNPETGMAVQIQTLEYAMIGWAPRYLVNDLVASIAKAPGAYSASVVRVNPVPAPSKQRILIELSGHWPDHDPMSSGEFVPLVD